MALKHVKSYFREVEQQYFEMLSDAKDLDEALKGGFLEQEQVDQAKAMMDKIKENYDRLCYIMVLFNKPSRKKSAKKFEKQNSKALDYLKNSSQDAIITENTDVLNNFRAFIKTLGK